MASDTAFEVEPPNTSSATFEVEAPADRGTVTRATPKLACTRWAASLAVVGTLGIGTLFYMAGKPFGDSTNKVPQTKSPAVQSVPLVAAPSGGYPPGPGGYPPGPGGYPPQQPGPGYGPGPGYDPNQKPPVAPAHPVQGLENLPLAHGFMTGFWYDGHWTKLGPNQSPYTQQFECKEKRNFIGISDHYKFELKQYEDAYGREIATHIDAKVLRIEPHFWTMHARADVFSGQSEYMEERVSGNGMNGLDGLQLHMPYIFNLHYTWRVTRNEGPVLFTIQKKLFATHCKYVNFFKCKQVVKIYVGHKGDESTMIYYGVGDYGLDEPDFKFYHSEDQFHANKKLWVAKIDHKKTKTKKGINRIEDSYKIKVKPGEDSTLLLLATYCLDQISDNNKVHDD